MRQRRVRTAAPDAGARFAAEYEGPYAPEDALWWLEHPNEPGPSGARSPAARAERARAAVYGRDATESDRAALRELEQEAAAARTDAVAARVRAESVAAVPRAARSRPRRSRAALIASIAVVTVVAAVALPSLTRTSAAQPATSPTVGPYVDTGRTTAPTAAAGSTVISGTLVDPVNNRPAAFDGAVEIREFVGQGVAQLDLPAVKGATRIGVAITCAKPSTYAWLVTGPSVTGFTGVQLAVSDVRSCTGRASIVIEPVTGPLPSELQVAGSTFDVVVAEFR